MASAQLRHLRPGLRLLQNRDDLFFAKPCSLHVCLRQTLQLLELLHGEEREVFGDQAYWKEDDREFLES